MVNQTIAKARTCKGFANNIHKRQSPLRSIYKRNAS